MARHIVVLGWYGHQNIGDQSYAMSIPLLFPGFDFTFTDDLRKTPAEYDYLILGGGNVIDRSFFDQIGKVKSPKLLLSVGLPNPGKLLADHINMIKKANFEHICVRDYASFDFLYKKGLEVSYLPDFAFALRPDKAKGKQLLRKLFKQDHTDLYEKVVGVVLNGYLVAGNELLARDYITFHKVAFDIARCADQTNASFIFIPFGGDPVSNDRIPNSWVASRCKWWKKNCVVYDRLDVQETLDVISACDTMISTRLHSSIFSTMSGVPFIDLTHHDKNRVYLESIAKLGWSLDYWMLDASKLKEKLNEHLSGNDNQELLVMSSINRQTLMANASKFVDEKRLAKTHHQDIM